MTDSNDARARFFEVFAAETARLGATEYGAAFVAHGLRYEHTGGGCTAWILDISEESQVIVTAGDETGECHLTAEIEAGDVIQVGLAVWEECALQDGSGYREFPSDQFEAAAAYAARLGAAAKETIARAVDGNAPQSGQIADTVEAGARVAMAILREIVAPMDLLACDDLSKADEYCDANLALYGAFAAVHFEEIEASNPAHAEWVNAVSARVSEMLKA